MTVEEFLILVAVVGAATFAVAYPVVANPRWWTREGWNWWLVAVGLALLGGQAFIPLPATFELWLDHGLYALFAGLTWHRVYLLFTARREVRRREERTGLTN